MGELVWLVIVIIGMIISASNKKKKKTKPNVKQPNNAAVQRKPAVSSEREQRIAAIRAEIEKRKAELERQKEQQLSFAPSEGESLTEESGSMVFDSTEGECICDPELEHERETPVDPQSVYANAIGAKEPVLDFSAKGILQGVIMSEVLTRPAQRGRKR